MTNVVFSAKRLDNGDYIESSSVISFADSGKVYLTNGVTPVYTDISGRGNLRSVFGDGYDEIFYEVDPKTIKVRVEDTVDDN